MKKILLAFDGTQFSKGAFDFAHRLNKIEPVMLTGVFISQISYANLWSFAKTKERTLSIPMVEDEEAHIIEQNIERFENLCQVHDISYRVHKDFYNFALPELQRETRCADVLIISGEKFFHNIIGEYPIEYISDALKEAECPVFVVPEKFEFPVKNIFAYDDSASSVYAIKQFVYLFPELCKQQTTVLYFARNGETAIPEIIRLQELMQQHFKKLSFLKIDINPKKEFNTWISE